ncbi:MAG: tetratricopeptide repeat protein [Candidatus Riflebacteria bacterium]|nr:tetratricopeptide repeat protein [Candidatus Riflebacteria bacterium]
MVILEALEKLFAGWRATIRATSESFRVTVPLMSDGAMKVMRADIESQLPAVYGITVTPTTEGGYVFDLEVEVIPPDSVANLVASVATAGLKELEPLLGRLSGEPDRPEQGALTAELGLELEGRRQFDLAHRAHLLARRLAPSNLKILFNLATFQLKVGEVERAMEGLREILEVDPGFEPALHNLAAYHAQRGETELARQALDRLLAAHPDSGSAHVLAGQIAFTQNLLGQALEHFLTALKYGPKQAEAYYRAALVFSRLQMPREAQDHWAAYARLARPVPEGRFLPSRLVVRGWPDGASIIWDGQPVGNAPLGLEDLHPGPHQLAVRLGHAEILLDLALVPGQTLMARYDLTRNKLTYEDAPPIPQFTDELGKLISGPELGLRILKGVCVPEQTGSLTPREIFAIVLHECLKDGELSELEKDLVFQVKQLLKIPADVHQNVFKEVESRIKGHSRDHSEADPEGIYRLIARQALVDGQVLSEENYLLERIGKVLSVPPSRREEIHRQIKEAVAGTN